MHNHAWESHIDNGSFDHRGGNSHRCGIQHIALDHSDNAGDGAASGARVSHVPNTHRHHLRNVCMAADGDYRDRNIAAVHLLH